MKIELKELIELAQGFTQSTATNANAEGVNTMIGKKCIIRTHTAGVWFGTVIEKAGAEVVVEDARRLWRWHTNNNGISLSSVALTGVKASESIIEPAVPALWLEAIELIPCEPEAIESLERCPNAQAE